MTLFLITVAAIAFAMSMMAVGTIVAKRSLQGSCGGLLVHGSDGEPLNCDICPHRDELLGCDNRITELGK